MELWIRSQDSGLFNPKIIKPPLEDGSIWCYIENTNILLGQYKTKERALEVLDEIQQLIKPRMFVKKYENEIKNNPDNKLKFDLVMTPKKDEIEIAQAETVLYEMPQE